MKLLFFLYASCHRMLAVEISFHNCVGVIVWQHQNRDGGKL